MAHFKTAPIVVAYSDRKKLVCFDASQDDHFLGNTLSISHVCPATVAQIDQVIYSVTSFKHHFSFFFHYYKYTGDRRVDQILDWVRQLPPEKNNYSLKFKELGCTIEDALESQACIQLKTNYCNQRRCLSCTFGHKLLNL